MTFTLDDDAKTVVQPSSGFVDVDFTGGTIFTWRVYSTDAPGHYAYRSNLVSLVRISAAECQIAGGACGSVPVNYSIDVVARQAPEPASVALVGAGLAGFAIRRRRR